MQAPRNSNSCCYFSYVRLFDFYMLQLIISASGKGGGIPKFHLCTYAKTATSLFSLKAIVKGTNFAPILQQKLWGQVIHLFDTKK